MTDDARAPDPALVAALSALKMALAFVDDELDRRRESGVRRYICEAATTAQHLKDAIRCVEGSIDIN